MDIFKLGVRDIFGIVLPGAVLLFVIIYVFWTLPVTLGLPALDVSLLKDQGFLLSIAFFVASYLLGHLLRLGTVSQVDEESSECCLKEWRRRKENQALEEHLKKLLDQMRRGEDISDIPTEFDHWVWRAEPFPYPVWYLRKAAFSYPHEVREFFNQYKHCMGLVPDSLWIAGRQFFNYCKMMISKEDSVLREEINAAEGDTRFLVGTYRALKSSLWIFATLLAFQLIAMAVLHLRGTPVADLALSHLASLILSTLLLIAGSRAAQIHIKRQFRGIRLREVDIVYDAFYLVCKEKGHDAKPPRDPETTRPTFSEDR
jgi:hypothetical protein